MILQMQIQQYVTFSLNVSSNKTEKRKTLKLIFFVYEVIIVCGFCSNEFQYPEMWHFFSLCYGCIALSSQIFSHLMG